MLTQERLKEVLEYSPETGIFKWKIKRSNFVKAGDIAGRKNSHGYIEICVDGTIHKAHRLAWFYTHGIWPAEKLDHRNLKRSDNVMSNLREATNSQNLCNQKVRSDNRSGVKGVHWLKAVGKWRAKITIDGTPIFLGLFQNIEDAAQAVRVEREKLHGEFANHGISQGI